LTHKLHANKYKIDARIQSGGFLILTEVASGIAADNETYVALT